MRSREPHEAPPGADDSQPHTTPSASTVGATDPAPGVPSDADVATAGDIDGPVVVTRELDAAEEASIRGTVELRDGCLVLGPAGPDGDIQLVWTPGTTWNATDEQVVGPDGQMAGIGDEIEGGGGGNALDSIDFWVTDTDAVAHLERCADSLGTDSAWVIQSRWTAL